MKLDYYIIKCSKYLITEGQETTMEAHKLNASLSSMFSDGLYVAMRVEKLVSTETLNMFYRHTLDLLLHI